jgi:hypothetical protein
VLAVEVVELLNRERQLGLTLIGRCPDGASGGAFYVVDATGTRSVLKFSIDDAGEYHLTVDRRLDRLRALGAPIARQRVYVADVVTAVVQELLAGTTGRPMTNSLVDQLLAINVLQSGLADEPPDAWRNTMATSLTDGLVGYCEHGSLLHDARTVKLLDRIRSVGRDLDLGALSADDIVHYDLHPGNVLTLDDDHLSGIVDWTAFVGDRLIDVVMLAFTSMQTASDDTLDLVWSAVFDMDSSDRTAAYVAHSVLRLVDWIIRHSGRDEAEWAVVAGEYAFGYVDAGRFTGFGERSD